jgi:competence protein ComEC
MMKSGEPLRAQVLKVGHHGSRYATSGKFLEAVAPEVAIISCGAGNRYDHPAQATLDRLQKAGVKIYRTDLNGEIAIITDGNKFEIHTARRPIQVALWPGSAGVPACLLSALSTRAPLWPGSAGVPAC